MSQGYIKLYRDLLDKPIWIESTPEQKTILITLLLMANHKEKEWEWKGDKYRALPGQFVTSLESIANKAGKGISIQNVRTAIKRFEKYGFLTNESTNKNRLITLVNWVNYQNKNDELTSKLTGDQQALNKQLTTNKNVRMQEGKEVIPYAEIISYLNDKAGKSYKTEAQGTRKLIKARWNEGHRVDDFKHVIDHCVANWKDKTFSNGENGSKYLRPSTLFNSKFDERINEKPKSSTQRHDARERSIEREIALNRWIENGHDPDEFQWSEDK